MKVVLLKSNGYLAYYQSPDFEEGKGIENAVALFGSDGYTAVDFEEVDMSLESIQTKFDAGEKL